MNNLHFPAREIPPYGEYATTETLVVGQTYFSMVFVDQQMRIPELTPLVFIGRNLAERHGRVVLSGRRELPGRHPVWRRERGW